MERAGAFISKLQQQYQDGASNASLLLTAQMLLAELQQEEGADNTNSKVSVTMPHPQNITVNEVLATETPAPDATEEPAPPAIPEIQQPEEPVEEPETPAEMPVNEPPEAPQQTPEETPEQAPQLSAQPGNNNVYGLRQENPDYFMPGEVPTLAQQGPKDTKELFELNTPADAAETSLNDKMKNSQANELMNKLQEEPIKDLKKAIGINDRYVFVNELFRGDETMYERSIKTLNSFSVYQEAAYWIQREMKYKLGWDDNNETVKHFNQLVKRRFA